MREPLAAVCMSLSTKDGGERNGLKAQVDACRDYANRVSLTIVAEYEDRMSAKTIDRPNVQALREAAAADLLSDVVFYDETSVGRRIEFSTTIRNALHAAGVSIHYAATGGIN